MGKICILYNNSVLLKLEGGGAFQRYYPTQGNSFDYYMKRTAIKEDLNPKKCGIASLEKISI